MNLKPLPNHELEASIWLDLLQKELGSHIVNLTSLGPRVAGSYENEVLAVNFLTKTINNIIKNSREHRKILLDVTPDIVVVLFH